MKRPFVLLAAVLCLSAVGVCGQRAKNSSRVLRLCELVDNWKDYNRREVRVRAIYRVGAEQTWLYDPVCRKGEGLTDVVFRQHTKGATKKLDRLVAKDKRAWVVLVGVFFGPELYQNVDPKLPAAIQERLEKSPKRYGHMDSFESMINVTRVVEASEVAADVPASAQPALFPAKNPRFVALTALFAIGATLAQDRFGSEHGGKFRGFTKSPGEHIMNEFDGLPEVRSVRGRIVDTAGVGLSAAIFEIRTENPDGKVRGSPTKPDGRFQLRSVSEGVYMFKVTRHGFQSVFGKLRVNKQAPSGNVLRLELQPGV